MYYPCGLHSWLFDSNIIHKIFGYGIRSSGIGLNRSEYSRTVLANSTIQWRSSWAIECDVIGVLLGGGIVTFLSYYWMLFRNFIYNQKFRYAIFVIAIGGLMYNFCTTSYIILVFIAAAIQPKINAVKGDVGASQ